MFLQNYYIAVDEKMPFIGIEHCITIEPWRTSRYNPLKINGNDYICFCSVTQTLEELKAISFTAFSGVRIYDVCILARIVDVVQDVSGLIVVTLPEKRIIRSGEVAHSANYIELEEYFTEESLALMVKCKQQLDQLPITTEASSSIEDDLIEWSWVVADVLFSDKQSRHMYIQNKDIESRLHLIMTAAETLAKAPPPPKVSKKKVVKKQELGIVDTLAALPIPKHIREKVNRETERLSKLQVGNSEYNATLDWLNWVAEIPWDIECANTDYTLDGALKLLNEEHFGLDEIKQELIEYLAVGKHTGKQLSSVLCFVGPPGTGKTTLAKQVATIMNRDFISIAMGGMRDDAELRGHRRTYLASRPGRIVTGLCSAGSMDPVILLDEVDKITQNLFYGDPVGALLELLDPTQAGGYTDRYLEFPLDISKAFFICTANDERLIPGPLLDRVELLEFRNYTEDEMREIIFKYQIPRIHREFNLTAADYIIDLEQIDQLCRLSTRQAEKKVRKMLRAAIKKMLTGESVPMTELPNIKVNTKRPMGF